MVRRPHAKPGRHAPWPASSKVTTPREIPPWYETVSETLTMQQSRTVDLRIQTRTS
ncbi:hypothetical protein ACFPTY_20075 [Halomonas beimenensis]|uniref:hypothetical protein n=1 Tax=Halomonas beimenensis TaxID=475662 RepID=UPI003618874E